MTNDIKMNTKLFDSATTEICQAMATTKKDYAIQNLRCCMSFLNALIVDNEEDHERLLNTVKVLKMKLEQKGIRIKLLYNDFSSLLVDIKFFEKNLNNAKIKKRKLFKSSYFQGERLYRL